MPKYRITADQLSAENLRVNLGLIGPVLSSDLSYLIDRELEAIEEYYLEEVLGTDLETFEKENNVSLWDSVTFDMTKATQNYADSYLNYLHDVFEAENLMIDETVVFDDLFADECEPDEYYGDYIPATITVDGEALLKKYVELGGPLEISDGREPDSGLYRTCSIEYWSLINVLKYIHDELAHGTHFLYEYLEEGDLDALGVRLGKFGEVLGNALVTP